MLWAVATFMMSGVVTVTPPRTAWSHQVVVGDWIWVANSADNETMMFVKPTQAQDYPRLLMRIENHIGGPPSEIAVVEADCSNGRLRTPVGVDYSRPNMKGVPMPLGPEETGWQTREPGTMINRVYEQACMLYKQPAR